MTRTNQTPGSSTANRLKALLALLAIFAVSAVITFGGRRALGRSLDSQPTPAELLQARADAVAAIPQLPKDTEDRLAAALYPQLAAITANFSDPIASGTVGDRTGQLTPARLAASIAAALPVTPPVPEKLSRLTQWQQAVRAANAGGLIPPSITTAYLISEVRPTGRVNMKGTQGAWLYIDAEKRQIPANIGAKFYDGVLASIDPDANTGGVVFRTSTGQTTMLHWDRQEDFTNTAPITTPTAGRGTPSQPESLFPQQRPVSQNNPATQPNLEPSASTNAPIAVTAPAQTVRPREDYSDLQVAVRDRYRTGYLNAPVQSSAQTTNGPIQPAKAIQAPEAASLTTQSDNLVISQNSKPEVPKLALPTQSQTETNSFSTGTFRNNKLNYAHAAYIRYARRPTGNTTSFRAFRNKIFNLDDPGSFSLNEPFGPLGEPSAETSNVADQPQSAQVDESQSKSPQIAAAAVETQTPQKDQAATPSPEPSSTNRAHMPAAIPAVMPAPTPQRGTLCDSSYRGESITITNESNRPLSLLNLVNRLNENYGPNIVLDYDVQETPVRLTISSAPWTSILRTLLDLNDLDMVCLDGGIVQIAKRSKIASMGDLRRRSAPVVREVFKLRYLQQTAGGRANLAGQTQASNGATIQSLEDAIRDILKAGGDPRGEARRVPGRNQLLVAATHEQMEEIRDLISRVDRPGYQVKISALVYTANENRLRDIGSQLSIVVGNTSGTNLAGGATLAATSTTTPGTGGTGTGTAAPPSGINPGGIPALATGMRTPTNGLGAGSPLATFGLSSLFGTAQFAYQLTLAQQKGIVNIQSRPFGIVSDGDTFDLVAGTQIPVVTTTIAGGAPFQAGQVQFIEASRIARITPQVAEDEQGNPNFVTLNIQLENNSVDTSLGTFNGVPGVNRQSLQTVLRLKNGETVVIGGLAADQVSNSQSSVPGLGGIPLLGNLFKKKTNQETRDRLYFAITVEVIPQDSRIPNFQAPADAVTTQPPPPSAQQPPPFKKRS